jgi:DNA-binding NtrC family response regulator
MIFKILIIDDEFEVCISLKEILESNSYVTHYATNTRKAEELLRTNSYGFILLDVKMPDHNGIDFLKIIKNLYPSIPVAIISGHTSIDDAVKAMKYGAINYYPKPISLKSLLEDISRIKETPKTKIFANTGCNIITQNAEMLNIIKHIETVAATNATVLLTGESGTGKELAADLLHSLSKRAESKIIKINCAAIPESLLESELFGFKKGSFTDAKEDRKGVFEAAHNGCLFLDEIGDMSLKTQAKILRVLQEKKFSPIGSYESKDIDVRIIAATNKDLTGMMESGDFRNDLYYRISVVTIELPPLRKRKDDIPFLSELFLKDLNEQYNKNITGFTYEVKELLAEHDWPGNIRELKNLIERAVIFTNEPLISIDSLPSHYKKESNDLIFDSGLSGKQDDMTKDIILEALYNSNGIKNEAAKLLKISRKTLYNKMKKLNIELDNEKS